MNVKVKEQERLTRKKRKIGMQEDRLVYIKYLKSKLAEAEEDFRNGRYMTLEEARKTTKEMLREDYESYHKSNSKK